MEDLPSFDTVSACVAYLKPIGKGARCILTGGPHAYGKVRIAFLHRGVTVTHEGPYGNRIIAFRELTDQVTEALRRDRAMPLGATQFFNYIWEKGISPGDKVFVQGYHRTLVGDIERTIGVGNYKLNKTVDPTHGKGWNLTYLTPEVAAERKKKAVERRAASETKALRYAAMCTLFGEHGIEIGGFVVVTETASYVKYCLSQMFGCAFKNQKFEFDPVVVDSMEKKEYKITRVS